MNRYLINGVLRDMRAGRRVIVVSGTRPELRATFLDVAAHMGDGERAFRTSGQERCVSPTGGVVLFLPRTALRGTWADVVVAEGSRPSAGDDLDVLAAAGAEVIR